MSAARSRPSGCASTFASTANDRQIAHRPSGAKSGRRSHASPAPQAGAFRVIRSRLMAPVVPMSPALVPPGRCAIGRRPMRRRPGLHRQSRTLHGRPEAPDSARKAPSRVIALSPMRSPACSRPNRRRRSPALGGSNARGVAVTRAGSNDPGRCACHVWACALRTPGPLAKEQRSGPRRCSSSMSRRRRRVACVDIHRGRPGQPARLAASLVVAAPAAAMTARRLAASRELEWRLIGAATPMDAKAWPSSARTAAATAHAPS